jgi:hypothetical protein
LPAKPAHQSTVPPDQHLTKAFGRRTSLTARLALQFARARPKPKASSSARARTLPLPGSQRPQLLQCTNHQPVFLVVAVGHSLQSPTHTRTSAPNAPRTFLSGIRRDSVLARVRLRAGAPCPRGAEDATRWAARPRRAGGAAGTRRARGRRPERALTAGARSGLERGDHGDGGVETTRSPAGRTRLPDRDRLGRARWSVSVFSPCRLPGAARVAADLAGRRLVSYAARSCRRQLLLAARSRRLWPLAGHSGGRSGREAPEIDSVHAT